jgi:hypothetical protein
MARLTTLESHVAWGTGRRSALKAGCLKGRGSVIIRGSAERVRGLRGSNAKPGQHSRGGPRVPPSFLWLWHSPKQGIGGQSRGPTSVFKPPAWALPSQRRMARVVRPAKGFAKRGYGGPRHPSGAAVVASEPPSAPPNMS